MHLNELSLLSKHLGVLSKIKYTSMPKNKYYLGRNILPVARVQAICISDLALQLGLV